jgi:hypothetical protein
MGASLAAVRRIRLHRPAVLLLLLVACARIEPPPGGPRDVAAPRLLAIRPDSATVPSDFDGEVEFIFDETVSEGSSPSMGFGTGDLEKLVLLSPTDRVPDVNWKRSRITVKPAEGWKPGRVYRVQLLAGVVDLRRNRSDTSTTVTFSTGAPLPTSRQTGRIMDWTLARPARGALVIAILLPDSLPYRTLADTAGWFDLGPLPAGEYLTYGVLDQNRNQRRDGREGWDTVRVAGDTITLSTLWAFPHDTIGPRITSIAVTDSLTGMVSFSQPLDPAQRLDASSVRLVLLPDSTPIAVSSLLPKRLHDSLYPAQARTDTTPRDTLGPALRERPVRPVPVDTVGARVEPTRPPVPVREPLADKLWLRVASPWTAGAKYLLEVHGVRNANLASADARQTLTVPEPKPVPADTTRAGPDSLKAAPAPAPPAPPSK